MCTKLERAKQSIKLSFKDLHTSRLFFLVQSFKLQKNFLQLKLREKCNTLFGTILK